MLWILALAKARSAVPISTAISAKRATQASAKINATLEGARQKGSWLRRLLVTAPCGDAPRLLLAICPSASTRDLLQYFNSLLDRTGRSDWVRNLLIECLKFTLSRPRVTGSKHRLSAQGATRRPGLQTTLLERNRIISKMNKETWDAIC